MRALSLLKRICKACATFVIDGIDYACYIVEEFRNVDGKRNEWGGELNKIEPIEPERKHKKLTGKINLGGK